MPDRKWCEDGAAAGHGQGAESQRYMVARFRLKPELASLNGKDYREGPYGRG